MANPPSQTFTLTETQITRITARDVATRMTELRERVNECRAAGGIAEWSYSPVTGEMVWRFYAAAPEEVAA